MLMDPDELYRLLPSVTCIYITNNTTVYETPSPLILTRTHDHGRVRVRGFVVGK